ncbi:hypothetical protein ACFORO_25805 [Amycolatopsis halotolerans]|uniref:Uncharacterized protein n=1 Tax=Amycolatopsis halotolerans TaxID=330083 RepID=A0ABV7QNY4_9PSEU
MTNQKQPCGREGCTRPKVAKDLCRTHYARARQQARQEADPAFVARLLERHAKLTAKLQRLGALPVPDKPMDG